MNLSVALRRDLLAGAAAGLLGGLVSGWALHAQDRMAETSGLLGLTSSGGALALHLAVSMLIGAGFGAIFRYQPGSYAATITSGVLYGLLWWIAGPLTLTPLLSGDSPTWSLGEAGAAFPSLVAHLLYGGLTGFAFHGLVSAYLRRNPEEGPPAIPADVTKTRVVILGGGFGGLSTAQKLEQIFARDRSLDATLVSQSNYLLFTPMLAEVASSGLEAQHISAPVRAALPRTEFRRAEVVAVDTKAQVVEVRATASGPAEALPYDHLVLAVGSVPHFHGLPGLAENSFTLKTLQDATLLRNHVISLLEQADVEPDLETRRKMLTFVVAGGGFAGTEMIAELFDLAHSVGRYYQRIHRQDLRFVLIHSGEKILPELSAELAIYSQRKLEERGIEFLLGARVAGATPDAVLLTDGRAVPTRTLVWTAGNQPNPVLATIPCEHNRAGAVVAEATLQVKGFTNIWAVGDCAQIPDLVNEGKNCPPTAQHALRQGKVLGHNIAATIAGRPLKPFRFRTIGMLVALGHRTAAAEVYGRRFSGLLAWMMWRSIYLSKLPGLEKKVRVALDWTIDLFFPRDIVLTGNPPTPSLPQMMSQERERSTV
jgi:NADH dehydrogenase